MHDRPGEPVAAFCHLVLMCVDTVPVAAKTFVMIIVASAARVAVLEIS